MLVSNSLKCRTAAVKFRRQGAAGLSGDRQNYIFESKCTLRLAQGCHQTTAKAKLSLRNIHRLSVPLLEEEPSATEVKAPIPETKET